MPRLRSSIPNLCSRATRRIRDFDLRLGGCGICTSEIYFLIFLENNERKRLKWPSARFCDSTYGSGATPYGARVLRAPYMIKTWGLEHLIASNNRKYLENYSMYLKEGIEATRRMFWLLEVLDDAKPSTQRLEDLATKSSGACQTRDSGTAYRHRMF